MAKYQTRTFKDLHSKDLGNRKFAKVVEELQCKGYMVDNIKEYYENYAFVIEGVKYHYSKDWKASAKDYVDYIIHLHETTKEIKQFVCAMKKEQH